MRATHGSRMDFPLLATAAGKSISAWLYPMQVSCLVLLFHSAVPPFRHQDSSVRLVPQKALASPDNNGINHYFYPNHYCSYLHPLHH